jgi:hypothetical protein
LRRARATGDRCGGIHRCAVRKNRIHTIIGFPTPDAGAPNEQSPPGETRRAVWTGFPGGTGPIGPSKALVPREGGPLSFHRPSPIGWIE